MRWIVGGHAVTKQAASTSQMGRFDERKFDDGGKGIQDYSFGGGSDRGAVARDKGACNYVNRFS